MSLIYDHLTRQLDIINPAAQTQSLHIVGSGAIGSFLALQCAKCGWTDITVYDFDTVSLENMSNQFFRFSDIGKNKVDALHDLIFDFTGIKVKTVNKKIDGSDLVGLSGILFYCVDSMSARSELTEALRFADFERVIDTRMSAEFLRVQSFRPSEVESYKKTLSSDENTVAERCTAKSTVYTACLAASLALKVLKNHAMNEPTIKLLLWDIKSNSASKIYSNN